MKISRSLTASGISLMDKIGTVLSTVNKNTALFLSPRELTVSTNKS